jgi:hypothetical protein
MLLRRLVRIKQLTECRPALCRQHPTQTYVHINTSMLVGCRSMQQHMLCLQGVESMIHQTFHPALCHGASCSRLPRGKSVVCITAIKTSMLQACHTLVEGPKPGPGLRPPAVCSKTGSKIYIHMTCSTIPTRFPQHSFISALPRTGSTPAPNPNTAH